MKVTGSSVNGSPEVGSPGFQLRLRELIGQIFSRGSFGLDFFTKAKTMRKDIDTKTNLIVMISVAETVGSRYA